MQFVQLIAPGLVEDDHLQLIYRIDEGLQFCIKAIQDVAYSGLGRSFLLVHFGYIQRLECEFIMVSIYSCLIFLRV